MPIFEYECKQCEKDFERLVFPGEERGVSCPECKSMDIKKRMSVSSFMGSSIGTCATGPVKNIP